MTVSILILFTLLGVITQRVVGFGIAPFLSPVALIFFSPPVAVVTTIFVGTLSCVIILVHTRRHNVVVPIVIFRILITAIFGSLVGAYIVTRIDKASLQILLGVIVILAALVQEYWLPTPTRSLGVTKGIGIAGFLAGLFNATSANGAPPIAMWLRTHRVSADQIRQNIAAMFIVVNICSLLIIHHLSPTTFNRGIVINFVLLVPAIVVGNFLGARLIKKVNVKLYEKLVVAAIIFTGLVSAAIGLSSRF